jgi:hypothetical protein
MTFCLIREGLERSAFDDVHSSSAYDSIFVTKKSARIIIRCRNKTHPTPGPPGKDGITPKWFKD